MAGDNLDNVGGMVVPHIVFTVDGLHAIVRAVEEAGEFCFDVETRGDVSRHPDVLDLIEQEWKEHSATLKATNPDILRRSKEGIISKWSKSLALDPLRNEVIWLGVGVGATSWVIPMGHPNGYVLEPAQRGDGSTVPPPGFRKILKSGKESLAKSAYFKPAVFSSPPGQLSKSQVFDVLRPIFMGDALKIGHNVKFDARSVRKYLGGELPAGPFGDTMLAQHILNENLSSYSLEGLLAHNFDGFNPYALGGKLGATITESPFLAAARYLHLDVRWTWLLYQRLSGRLMKDTTLYRCFEQDMEVLRVLMDMEDTGIPVNSKAMKSLGKQLDAKINNLMMDMLQYAPVGFNPSSTRDKQILLFNKKSEGGLGLKASKTTPGGQPSVDEETLKKIESKHPIIPMLLDYSETKKLVSTYVDGLLSQLVKGRLHPSFHLHRTVTGRLASSSPNLQNIPRDSDIRSLFVAPEGYDLLVADYDQIELRVMCMFSQDKRMSEFFLTGADIHAGAAALCLGKPLSEITPDERQLGKGSNFLTAYGGGYMKLARTMNIPEDQARAFIDQYYRQFSGITKWKQQVIRDGKTAGYVTTMSGRRRRLPDLHSPDDGLRSRAERQAVNAVVQGSASDICKQAMVDCYEAFADTKTQLLVQVHDELVVATPSDQVDIVRPILMQAMGDGKVYSGIPLKVSCHSATSWSEAKGK
jgi:DNA polymerase-1